MQRGMKDRSAEKWQVAVELETEQEHTSACYWVRKNSQCQPGMWKQKLEAVEAKAMALKCNRFRFHSDQGFSTEGEFRI